MVRYFNNFMIYFVRHGLSEANAKRVFAGQKDDSPLVEEGRKQAKETGKKILEEGIKIDKIISSPLARAYETAQIIAKELGFNIYDKEIYSNGSITKIDWIK